MIKQIQPLIGKEEAQAVYDTIMSTQLTEGPKTEELEKKICEYTGYKHAIAVSNWTDGLMLCVKTLQFHRKITGLGIIIPNLTFVASANAPFWCDMRPHVLDVNEDGQLDANVVEDYLKIANKMFTNKVHAIMLVDLYGSCPELDDFNTLAKKYDVSIIEDAAQAFGVCYKGKHVGAYCDDSIGGFSFYGNKQIVCGEGGVLVTNNSDYYNMALALKQHGSLSRGTFTHEHVGFNFRFDDVRATILLEQLKKAPRIMNGKKLIHDYYQDKLQFNGKELFEMFPKENKNIIQNYWFSNILIGDVLHDCDGLQKFLKESEIETRRMFKPLHQQKCYSGMDMFATKINTFKHQLRQFPISEKIYRQGLSLPSHLLLTVDDLTKITNKVIEYWAQQTGDFGYSL